MSNLDYYSADKYDNSGWIVTDKRRVQLAKDPETGLWVAYDTETGERVGSSPTRTGASILRRKYEVRGFRR